MGKVNRKYILLTVAIIVVLSLATTQFIFVQSTPNPSVPEFSLKYVNYPRSVQTTDPYTGETSTQNYNNKTIEVIIKNQQFASSVDGVNYALFYNIRIKGHFEDEWETIYNYKNYTDNMEFKPRVFPADKTSQYTTCILTANIYPDNAQVDVQVAAVSMYDGNMRVGYSRLQIGTWYEIEWGHILDKTTNWSNTQTITIPANDTPQDTPTPSTSSNGSTDTPNATDTPTEVPLTVFVAVTAVFVVIIIALLLLMFKKSRKTNVE
jgi:hypothetical protein